MIDPDYNPMEGLMKQSMEREAKKAAYGSEDSRASHRDNEEEKGGIFCAIRDFLDLMDFLDLLHGLR